MRPEVKICGLKKPADAQYVNDAGADYAGFVFYEKSRRNLSRQQAEEIMKKISPRIKKVAVTVFIRGLIFLLISSACCRVKFRVLFS